jgi:multiple sugar transport system substrate-binding protein
MGLNKKTVIVVCALTCLVFSVFAADVRLQIVCTSGVGGEGVLGGIVPDFEKAYPNIKVSIIPMPMVSIEDKMMVQFLGAAGEYDLVTVIESWIGKFSQYLEPLDERLAKDRSLRLDEIAASPLNSGKWNGKQYALPYRWGANILYFRQDLFREYGVTVPRTWPEYLEAAKKLTLDLDKDGKIDIYGATLYANPGSLATDTFNVLRTWGGDLLEPPRNDRSALLRPESIEAMRFYVSLLRTHHVVPPESVGWNEYEEALNAFNSGRLAMFIGYSPARALIVEDPTRSKVAGKVGYSTVPIRPGLDVAKANPYYSVGWLLAMDKAGKNKDAAYLFMKYASSQEAQKKMALQFANGPTRSDVFDSPDFGKLLKPDAIKAIKDSFAHGTGRPATAKYSAVFVIWNEAVSDMLAGNKTVEAAMKDAHAQINKLLQE